MLIDEIKAGESQNLEFKETLPDKSLKYMKTVVAFANGNGGKIIFGVEDKTRRVVGISDDALFKTMDAITNAISDSCEPAIYPDISLQTVDEKTIIVVDIPIGRQRPYYIKSMGKEAGVFIRVAGTSRQADDYMTKELLFEGANRSFDQAICLGLNITADDISLLCRSMKETALKNCRSNEEKASIKDVTAKQLLTWGILQERDGKYIPTNAYALLTGNDILPTVIQCGVFKGTTKAVFVDRREYTGPIQEQVEEALRFVLRNIHMGAEFSGLARHDVYEIPVESIRELLMNAVIHRSYLNESNIQVAIYDDRLEITSPGKLPIGQTIEKMKAGYSQIRNKAIAHAFYYMKMMEKWGSGIPRIIESVVTAGLREPEFIDGDIDLRINIYRRKMSDNVAHNEVSGDNVAHNVAHDVAHSETASDDVVRSQTLRDIILDQIRKNNKITREQIAAIANVSKKTVERELKKLNNVYYCGSGRNGYWKIDE